ncbi:MAG: PIN domain-containing protein [Micropepsaceae bacterium]
MPSVLVDAGPLIALFNRGDRHHTRALRFVQGIDCAMVTNLPILAEVMANLDFSVDAQLAALSWVGQSIRIDEDTADDLPRIKEIMAKYRDLPADFGDASLVALAERTGVHDVATIDKDFLVYRANGKKKFTNVFMVS